MDAANYFSNALPYLETFAIFDIAHNFLACMEVKAELDGKGKQFSRINPFASWIITIAYIFSGSLTTSLLLCEPVIAPLSKTKLLIIASLMWYFVFFPPFDIICKAKKSLNVRILASALNEIYRVQKIENGILHASKFYPNSWIIMIAIATVRSNGSGLMKLLIRQMQKAQNTRYVSFMHLPISTKISILAGFVLILEKNYSWLASFELKFGISILFIYIKISSFNALTSIDCLPFERSFCSIFFNDFCINESDFSKPEQKKENSNDAKKES